MSRAQKITLTLSEKIVREIEKYRITAHKPSRSAAVRELLQTALSFPPYFRTYDREQAEREADEDIAAGRVNTFETVEDLLADLKQ